MRYLLILSLFLIACGDQKGEADLLNCQNIIDAWPNNNITGFPFEGEEFSPICEFEDGLQCETEEIGTKHLNFYCKQGE